MQMGGVIYNASQTFALLHELHQTNTASIFTGRYRCMVVSRATSALKMAPKGQCRGKCCCSEIPSSFGTSYGAVNYADVR